MWSIKTHLSSEKRVCVNKPNSFTSLLFAWLLFSFPVWKLWKLKSCGMVWLRLTPYFRFLWQRHIMTLVITFMKVCIRVFLTFQPFKVISQTHVHKTITTVFCHKPWNSLTVSVERGWSRMKTGTETHGHPRPCVPFRPCCRYFSFLILGAV